MSEITERRTIWIVTSGEYSDYSVHAAFATQADAQAAVDAGYAGHEGRVEELDWYPSGAEPVRAIGYRLYAQIDAKTAAIVTPGRARSGGGYVFIAEPAEHPAQSFDEWMHPADAKRRAVTKVELGDFWGGVKRWEVTVSARTEKHARKVFYDLVAKVRAEILEGHR